MIKLTKEQILLLHTQLIETTGGSDGIRDMGLLESALESPFQSYGGEELYPSIQAKAARLCYGLVKNHAMIDGNKRLGCHAMLVILALNGYEMEYTQEELSDLILDVAADRKQYEDILHWLEDYFLTFNYTSVLERVLVSGVEMPFTRVFGISCIKT